MSFTDADCTMEDGENKCGAKLAPLELKAVISLIFPLCIAVLSAATANRGELTASCVLWLVADELDEATGKEKAVLF